MAGPPIGLFKSNLLVQNCMELSLMRDLRNRNSDGKCTDTQLKILAFSELHVFKLL